MEKSDSDPLGLAIGIMGFYQEKPCDLIDLFNMLLILICDMMFNV